MNKSGLNVKSFIIGCIYVKIYIKVDLIKKKLRLKLIVKVKSY